MKKVIFLTMIVLCLATMTKAQNDTIFHVNDMESYVEVCTNKYDRALIYAEENCSNFGWLIYNQEYFENPIIITPETCPPGATSCNIDYAGCGHSYSRAIEFTSTNVPQPVTFVLWKHQGETIAIEPVGTDSLGMYNFQWSPSDTVAIHHVSAPGSYPCSISDNCGSSIRTFIVRDNVEIEHATCDLESNLNMVTWSTTSEQAQYIDHVIVKRDGMQVGTANYSDGQFTDNIGSGSASRTYTIVAIATDGTECPIESYPKETIHMSYTLGMNNTIEIGWNTPTGYDLIGYNICEWHENDGSLSVIDYVGASVTSYTCSQNQFDQGYIVVQGVEAGKDGETRLLSNRSLDLVGLGENETAMFKVYPNPAKDHFIVEGSGTMTITNALGQTILTREIDGKTSIELPQGLYFVKLGEIMRKIVAE